MKDSALITAQLKVISTIPEYATFVTFLARNALVPPLTNVHPVMKQDPFFLRMALALKNAQILLILIRTNSSVTLVKVLAKLVQGLP